MPGVKKSIVAVAIAGGVLALGGTAAAFGSGGERWGTASPVGGSPVTRDVPAPRYTGPDRDEVHTGPWNGYRGPSPRDCTSEEPGIDGERARSTALERVPGARVTGVELDRCYGLEWELELRKANTEYEVTVDAHDGDVVGYEEDRDD
ncbi:Peptidase propeptide and YPEB domain-containing protein [Actinopolyspora lacussalsi subsp. righensis]|uniref:Peptidase propeptide and YPEB domain-containing protein n=1 Tax=Actinopolyspora righensis TaxID=995060 RepID=A0A1I6Y521_9ACTN|nr:PepSY domain-containing protein [Actinopolyspora righensis]SFT45598.1 Peptidase propeptide and YPEB domain-containing protein [Actinopolyspora righensis]